jgi:hypothetical protein
VQVIHLLWLSLAIPIAIHLVHRRKARPMPFSTLRFLRMVDQRVARRQRLKELLLLAARLLMLAALIGALYRPMVRSATFRGADVPTAAAIVLDNTASMRATAGGVSRFERARGAALQVLDGLRRGDEACVVPFDPEGDAPTVTTTGLDAVREDLGVMECGYGAGELAPALRRAVHALEASSNPRREVYVVTDLQKGAWTPAISEATAGLTDDVPVFLVDAGSDVEDNLSLADAAFGLNVQVVGATSDLYCRVKNTGIVNVERELSLSVDGEKVADRKVALAAGGEATVTFSHVFARPGPAAVEVRLDPDDLAADNARYLAVTVQERLPVLVVDGDPSEVPYLSESFFLKLALEPPSAAGRQGSPVQATVVTASELPRQRLEDYSCVILANVPQIGDLVAERLRRYVEAGGGLLVFLGDRVDAASYNAAFCPAGQGPLLPARLGAVREASSGPGGPGFRVRAVAEGHPALQGVGDLLTAGGTRVDKFFSTDPIEGRGPAPVLVGLDGGPLILEGKAGAGTVVLVTSSADLAWSNLAARRAFLPLLHRLVCYAGRSTTADEEVPVGAPYAVELPPDEPPVEVTVYGPGDAKEPAAVLASVRADGAHRALFAGTRRPGLYRVAYKVGGAAVERMFAVNVEERESDLTRIDPAEAAGMFGAGVCRTVRDPRALAGLVRREREGLPLWDYLFALALAFAVVEGFLGNVALRH